MKGTLAGNGLKENSKIFSKTLKMATLIIAFAFILKLKTY